MNLNPKSTKPRDGILVPADFAAQLAEQATGAALAVQQRRTLVRRLTWATTAIAAVFAGTVLILRPSSGADEAPQLELTSDDAWTAIELDMVTLTDDELFELAAQHGIISF